MGFVSRITHKWDPFYSVNEQKIFCSYVFIKKYSKTNLKLQLLRGLFQYPIRGLYHYSDVIMKAIVFQITGVSIVCSGAYQRKHKSCTSLAFVRGIHRWPVNSPHKGPVTWKIFPFDDVIMSKDLTKLHAGCFLIETEWHIYASVI